MASADDPHFVGSAHKGLQFVNGGGGVIMGSAVGNVAGPVLAMGGHRLIPLGLM